MTAQIDDRFVFRGRDYSVAGISEGFLFDPFVLGLHPVGTCTACWRGFQAYYAISDGHLVLDALHVNLLEDGPGFVRVEGPSVNGVTPSAQTDTRDVFNNHYEGLEYPLEYTGGVLLADGFIQELYVHMGFHPAWKYEAVVELVFAGGILTAEYDRSERMAEIRRMLAAGGAPGGPPHEPGEADVREFIERSFDRRYTL